MGNHLAEKKNDPIPSRVYIFVLIFSGLWVVLILLPALLINADIGYTWLSILTYKFFSNVCHQADERSFRFFGIQLAVCSRCFLIYLTFFAGVLLYPIIRRINNLKMPPLWILLSAAFLMFADAVGGAIGLFENTALSRSLTGGLLGLVLPFYIIPGLTNFTIELKTYFKKNSSDAATAE